MGDLRVSGTFLASVMLAIRTDFFSTKVRVTSMASTVHSLPDLLANPILPTSATWDCENRLDLPSSNWLDFTLFSNLLLALTNFLLTI